MFAQDVFISYLLLGVYQQSMVACRFGPMFVSCTVDAT